MNGQAGYLYPDQIIVNWRNGGGATINGPMTRQEKAEMDEEIDGARWLKVRLEADLEKIQGKLAGHAVPKS